MATNTIKGLTVEIGGDTTKLGKALEDVNKKSRDLSSELGQINKLLKLDPGNADLLAQKQKVLAEAVSNTAQKLDTLKEAEKQVQKQFERGEVSEAQVRALQREIVETSNKLKTYEKAAQETAEQVDKLGKKSKDAKKGTDDTAKGAGKAADSLDDLAKSADRAGDASDGLGSKLGSLVKGGLAALAAGVTAAVGAMVGSAEATREYRRELGKLDTAFTTNGHSADAATKTYQTLQGILGETDQAVEAANHLAKLTKNEEELARWTNVATGVYATFGASLPIENLTEAANETAKVGTLTGGLADALNWAGVNEEDFQAQLDACSNEQERQSLILETLNGLYSDAAEKYRETNAEVIRANEANEAWMASMADVGGAIEPVLTDVKLLGASLVSDLVPGVQQVAEAFRGMLNGEDGAAADLGAALSGIFDQILTKVTELLPQVAEVGVNLITTLATSVLEMAPSLARAFMKILEQAVNSAATAAPALLSAVIEGVFGVVNNLLAYIPDVLAAVTEFLGVLAAEVPNIATQIAEWVPEIVTALVDALILSIPQLLNGALLLLLAIVQAIPVLIEALAPEVVTIVDNIIGVLTESIPVLIKGALHLFQAIIDAIPLLIEALVPQIPLIVNSIVQGLAENIPQLLHGAIQLLLAIVQAIPVLIEALAPEVVTIVDNIIGVLTESIPVLIKGALHLFQAIIDAIPLLIEALVPQIPLIVNSIVQGLAENIPVLLNGALLLLNAIIDAIPLLLDLLIPQVPEIVNVVIDGLIEAAPLLLDAALELLLAIVQAIPQIVVMLAREVPSILDAILQVLSQLPELIWVILSSALTKMGTWVTNMTSKVVQFGRDAAGKAKTAAKGIFDAIVNGLQSLPGEIMAIGSDIVRGLWEGISDMAGWISEKIQGFGSNVLNGIKDFFGIASPSRVFRDEVGKMLATGLAEGIEKNAAEPLNAMADLSKDVLGEADAFNGLTLERKMQHTFAAPAAFSVAESGMLAKLDKILEAVERGQVLTIDGKTLVGSTAGRMDSTLGQRRALVARGAV